MSSGIYNKIIGYRNRRSIRLPGYDYTRPGYYFITVCVHDRKQNVFGEITDGPMDDPVNGSVGAGSKPAPLFTTNEYAEIVQYTWFDLPNHIRNITLDGFVIMPNHIHGIIRIDEPAGVVDNLNRAGFIDNLNRAGLEPAPTLGLPEMVRQLKTFSARRINTRRNTPGKPVWQRNYYEHIIRNEISLNFIRKYIRENPAHWLHESEKHINREVDELHMSENGCTK